MITALERIKAVGELYRDENFDFRSWLKMQDMDEVDEAVHELYEEYSSTIDCTSCGNCCMTLKPLVTAKDINRLAKSRNMSVAYFRNEYTETDEDGDRCLKDTPCRFLEDKKCTVYPDRPAECRSCPHLHKKKFISRLFGVIGNYSVCPIVFNVYEELKMRMGYKTSRI
jgi:Fe-S-cluster containining protein